MPTLSDHELSEIVQSELPGYRFVGSASSVDAPPPSLPAGALITPDLSVLKGYYRSRGVVSRVIKLFARLLLPIGVEFGGTANSGAKNDEVMVIVSPTAPLALGEKPHLKAAIISQSDKKITSIQG